MTLDVFDDTYCLLWLAVHGQPEDEIPGARYDPVGASWSVIDGGAVLRHIMDQDDRHSLPPPHKRKALPKRRRQ